MNRLQDCDDERGLSPEEETVQQTRASGVREAGRGSWARRRRKELLELPDQLDSKIAELTTVVEQEANQRSEAVRSRCWSHQTALSVVEFDDADHAGFHHRARLFSWDAPCDGPGPRYCRNDDCEPPAKRPLCGFDWVTVGSWSHDHDFRRGLGHHLVRSRDSTKNWPHHGIVCWPHVNSSGNSKSVRNYALDYRNIHIFAAETTYAFPRTPRLHSQS